MPAQRPTALIAVLVLCVLTGCAAGAGAGTTAAAATPSPVATPSPTVTPSATPTQEPVSAAQIVAVAKQFFTGDMTCHDAPSFAGCPITTRLAARMAEVIKEQSSYPTGGAVDWCRCQQYFNVTITAEVTPGGGMAHVMSGPLRMDFIMVIQGGKLLVDDTQCTGGGPSTSIYAPQLVVCG